MTLKILRHPRLENGVELEVTKDKMVLLTESFVADTLEKSVEEARAFAEKVYPGRSLDVQLSDGK